MVELPKRLVRFYGNNEYALECISFREIAIIHSRLMNDPFDPNFSFPPTESFDDNQLESAIQRIREELNKKQKETYLFCMFNLLEHHPCSLYMWSHYANGHKGVAIEFNANVLHDFLKPHASVFEKTEIHVENPMFSVEYDNDETLTKYTITREDIINLVQNQPSNFEEKLEGWFRVKSKAYEEEKEWRFIKTSKFANTNIIRLNDLPKDAINALYLGYCTNEDYLKKLVDEISKNFPSAKIFKAYQAKDKLALEFKVLN